MLLLLALQLLLGLLEELLVVELQLPDLDGVVLVDQDVDRHVQVLQSPCQIPIDLVLFIILLRRTAVVRVVDAASPGLDPQLVNSHFSYLSQDFGVLQVGCEGSVLEVCDRGNASVLGQFWPLRGRVAEAQVDVGRQVLVRSKTFDVAPLGRELRKRRSHNSHWLNNTSSGHEVQVLQVKLLEILASDRNHILRRRGFSRHALWISILFVLPRLFHFQKLQLVGVVA